MNWKIKEKFNFLLERIILIPDHQQGKEQGYQPKKDMLITTTITRYFKA